MRTIFWMAGGICAGLGVLLVTLYGFTMPGGEIATQISKLGFDALPDIGLTSTGYGAVALIFIGAWLMIKANVAIKSTKASRFPNRLLQPQIHHRVSASPMWKMLLGIQMVYPDPAIRG